MYQALYRKYRPQRFEDVVGQRHIIQTLKNAIDQNRIGHAYLFCGPRGTGKTTVAKIFAKMLNCESEHHKPCEKCVNCQMVQNGNHPDIIEIDAASNNGVDEVRNLIERVKYAPMQGKYKVYIIDEVHMMTTGAFNALLKTIEEPPAHVVFILATTEPNKVIPTIISRCQRFDFNKVCMEDLTKRITIVCEHENIQIDQEAIRLIAQLSDGGMRDALSILDQCVAFCTSKITVNDVRQIYGVVTLDELGDLFYALYKRNIEFVVQKIQEAEEAGMDLKRLTQDLISLLKDSIILDYAVNTDLVSDSNKKIIHEKISMSPSTFRVRVLDELMDVYSKFNYASSVIDYLETGLLKSIADSYEISSKIEPEKNEIDNSFDSEITMSNSKNSYETTSEQSEIEEKSTKNSDSEAISEENEISDVSRETLKDVKKEDRKIILSDEYVLQLLVGAQKTQRQIDSLKLKDNDMYLSDLDAAKYASTLRNVNLVASGNTYMIVSVKSEIQAKEINAMQLEEGYENYTEQLLGTPKVVFAVDSAQHNRVIDEFRQRMLTHTLPEAAEVIIQPKLEKSEVREETIEEKMKNYFPGITIIDD